jgi:hypothetical protein
MAKTDGQVLVSDGRKRLAELKAESDANIAEMEANVARMHQIAREMKRDAGIMTAIAIVAVVNAVFGIAVLLYQANHHSDPSPETIKRLFR